MLRSYLFQLKNIKDLKKKWNIYLWESIETN